MKLLPISNFSSHLTHGLWVALLSIGVVHSAFAAPPSQDPVIIGSSVKPIMMLNMSRDHQLFFKLYDDYGDITNSSGGEKDGIPDTTYIPKYEYYGYFDSKKCYKYDNTNQRFNPFDAADSDHYCTPSAQEWSGNFLNWASMTRVDAVRKILYGGLRSTDSASETILERALLPHDAHSFAKFYDGTDIDKLTPFTVPELKNATSATGITICNTTADNDSTQSMSHKISSPPLIRVVKGNYSLWASNERWQCRFDSSDTNGNKTAGSGIYTYTTAPAANSADKLNISGVTSGEYVVRVKVCVDGSLEDNCKQYPTAGSAKKPTGLFQEFGENGKILFGLMTGSYSKSKSGGVLRKTVGDLKTEINTTTNGTFTNADGAIKTLNNLKIYGYSYEDGTYSKTDTTGNDNCPGFISGFANGTCSNWGNPQSEIYLESLRYLAGLDGASAAFSADDSGRIAGLKTIAWPDANSKPVNSQNYCAPLSILQFNASSSSFDDDELGGASGLGIASVNTWIDELGNASHENLSGNYFIGQNSSNKNGICTGKSFSALSELFGTCPDAPRLKGGYGISGLAYYARHNDINSSVTGKQIVQTYGVALAPAVPSIKIPVPGSSKSIELLPACKSNRTTTTVDGQSNQPATREGNCAIVDFKIVKTDISSTNTKNTAKLYVNWEAAEQGLDYDQDMWGTLDVEVVSNEVRVTSKVFRATTGASMGFGYIISGTQQDDGFKVHSGIADFIEPNTYCNAVDKCTCRLVNEQGDCDITTNQLGVVTGLAVTPQQKYAIATGSTQTAQAKFVKSPLELAAKWGGYSPRFEKNVQATGKDLEDEINKLPKPETYFYATDPRMLEKSLQDAFNQVAATVGSSATVAANSTRLDGETYVYQALFNSEDWSGDISAYKVEANGSVNTSGTPKWKVSSLISRTGRNIYTYDGATSRSLVKLSSTGIDSVPSLKSALKLSTETTFTNATNRFKWLLGEDPDDENVSALRVRKHVLGDIVNSDPAFAGPGNLRYRFLPAVYGASSFLDYANKKRELQPSESEIKKRIWRSLILVGANDGMMHAFDADTGQEVFAYIPRGVYPKLAALSGLQYQHQYTVDGPISVGDVYFDADSDGVGGEWRTIAVGTLGAGGRGAYALDITDVLKSATGEPKIIFDVSAEDSTVPYRENLGFAMSRPLIVPTKDSNWKVIFANGPNSTAGTASLIAIDPENPISNYKVIDTQAKVSATSTDNGLFGLALLPDSNGVTEAAYGGDLLGNMWKFDLSDSALSKWDVAYKSGSVKMPLVHVVDALGNSQPITSTPTLGVNALKKTKNSQNIDVASTMVYFGTGKYYEKTDPNDLQVQSFYGIADIKSLDFKNNSDRIASLQVKEITAETATNNYMKRTVTNDVMSTNEWTNKYGWFVDLKLKNGTARGERVISKPLLVFDRLIFPTFIPSTAPCDYGGAGWLMELTGVGDKYVGKSVLGVLGNTSLETVILGDLIALTAGDNLYVMGSGLGSKELAPPIITKVGNNFGDKGRISWQQIK